MNGNVSIIGDGAMATVCSRILSEKNLSICLWSAFEEYAEVLKQSRENKAYLPGIEIPPSVKITSDPAEAFFDHPDIIISAVPTKFLRSVWEKLKPFCPAGVPICSATKGIENGTLFRPSQVLRDVLTGSADSDWPIVALSGPSIATEVAKGLPATVVSASSDENLARQVQQLFSTSYFRVYTNTDIIGVEIAGATKNVIAIAAGILDGLKMGDNVKAALLTRGLAEITRLGISMGGKRETFSGLAGLGDLVTTCISPFGRNRSFGEAIGRGKTREEAEGQTKSVVEGVNTTISVLELAKKYNVDMPITRAVYAVLFEGQDPSKAIMELMCRPLKAED
ncbi:MAG: NAD(P)-dependent glycerol-3-phosphate dehydrogenase [Planctomycetes bacterium]|nr:NAD(P)-dependent glycerol-3-phosphate dehydrogenase [Planctomycetota bacterium]